MGKDEAAPVSKTRMNTPAHNDVVDWNLVAERRFEDIEELNDLVQGWDFEFHQLKAGRSPAELLQFGRPEFMLSRFYFEQPYHQRGCTAQDALTIGLTEEGIEEVTTPDGAVQQDDILCFPSGRELSAVSRPRFKGYSLSISEALFDEVVASCGIQVEASIGTVQQVRHCSRSNMNTLRRELRCAIDNGYSGYCAPPLFVITLHSSTFERDCISTDHLNPINRSWYAATRSSVPGTT